MKMQEINNHKNLNSMVSKINIGQEIKEKMASGGIGVTELSNKTHIERRRLYRIFKKKSIDTDVLFNLSVQLKCDFFKLYSEELSGGLLNVTKESHVTKMSH